MSIQAMQAATSPEVIAAEAAALELAQDERDLPEAAGLADLFQTLLDPRSTLPMRSEALAQIDDLRRCYGLTIDFARGNAFAVTVAGATFDVTVTPR